MSTPMTIGPRREFTAVLISGVLALACEQPFEGNPAAATFSDSVQFVCNGWSPAMPSVDWGLFDIWFGRSSLDVPFGAPTSEQRSRVRAANGTIIYEFNLPVIRAVMRPVRVPTLEANIVRGVLDPSDFTLNASIGWDETGGDPDTLWMKSLGVTIRRSRQRTVDGRSRVSFQVTLPDSAIPLIRARPEVIYLEPQLFGCLDSG